MFVSQIQLIRFHNKDIQEQYENDSTEVVKTDDSLQRIDITGGPAKDTLRNNIGTGLRSKNAPFRRGGASNGVAAGPDRIKKAE